VLLCAGALSGGAALSHVTMEPVASARASAPAFPPAMAARDLEAPSIIERAVHSTVHAAVQPREIPRGSVVTEAPPIPHDPFAGHLRDGKVITGATPHRTMLFTFDDGPDQRNTPRLLDVLDEYGIKAVFFLTASRISGNTPWQQENQALAREIVARGHFVGNHTVDHAQLPLLDDAQVLAQVRGADEVFERVLGSRTWLMRPPGGARSARVDGLLAEHGYTQMEWNLGTGDFQVREPDAVFRTWRRVLERRERENGDGGGIILLHDTHEWSVEAVPLMVSWMRERNCALLERGEELYDIASDPAMFFAARGDASVSAEAPPAEIEADVLARRQRHLREETRQRCARLASR